MSLILRNSTKLWMPTIVVPQRSFFRKRKRITENPFILTTPTEKDTCEVLDLMWTAYHPDEPTTSALALGHVRNPVFDQHAFKILSQGYSVVAKCKFNGEIVGACLNEVTCPWDADMTEKFACSLACDQMTKLYMFFAYLQRVPRLYKKYCASQIFELSNLFVRPLDRNKGVAKRLVKRSMDLGVDLGFKVIRVDATNIHTAKICRELKMKMVYELPYCSYIGPNDQPVVNPPKPNTTVQVFVHTVK